MGGDPNVVAIQRAINGKYAYQMQQLIPCDGIIDRTMQSALLFVLEMLDEFPAWACRYALMPSNFGYFAPNLLTATPIINMGDSSPYSLLLQQTLYCNGYTDILFTGVYDQQTSVCVEAFKSEMVLGGGTAVDGETWESLLTSHGYSGRPARACDTAQTITLAQAQALKESGYVIIGRYLTDKFAMTTDEISDILAGGLSIFPIFETYGTYSSYFTTAQGIIDATQAVNAAQGLGIPEGTIIYFGVDCDILDNDVTETVIPYFEGINNQFKAMGSSYRVGVYGSRNICTQTYKAGLTVTSFVLDMSTGYSGNIMNFSMPENWAFNQFATISIDGVGIDKDGYSGRDTGFNTVDTGVIYQSLYNEVLKELNFKFIETSAGTVVSKVITSTEPEATICVLAEVQVSADIGNTKGVIQIVNGSPKLSVNLPEGVNLTFGEQGLASISKTIGNGDVSFGINKNDQVFIKIKTSEKFGSNESVADTLVLTVFLDPNYINPDEMPGAPELSPVQSVEWQTAVQNAMTIWEQSEEGKIVDGAILVSFLIMGVIVLLPEETAITIGVVITSFIGSISSLITN